MKYILTAAVIIFLVCAFVTVASGPVKPLICPCCEKPIKDGSNGAYKLINGNKIPIHFDCAFNTAWNERVKGLRD